MWNNLKCQFKKQFHPEHKVLLGVGSIPEYITSGGPAPADLTVLEEPFCAFFQFAFHHTPYTQGYIGSCERELTSCHSKLNLISQDVSLETK